MRNLADYFMLKSCGSRQLVNLENFADGKSHEMSYVL
jgi:hypothetical protein